MKRTKTNILLLVETAINSGANEDETVFEQETIDAVVTRYFETGEFHPETDAEDELWALMEEILEDQFERYHPDPRQEWEDNAPRIPVKIGDKEYQTYLDRHGVQRFVGNSVITRIMDHHSDPNATLSLNTLIVEYQQGRFSTEDWLDFMTSFGYSVGGLLDLSEFSYLPVENPLWEG